MTRKFFAKMCTAAYRYSFLNYTVIALNDSAVFAKSKETMVFPLRFHYTTPFQASLWMASPFRLPEKFFQTRDNPR